MPRTLVLYSGNANAAVEELRRLGGKASRQYSQSILVAEVPDDFDETVLTASTASFPTTIDTASERLAEAWRRRAAEQAVPPASPAQGDQPVPDTGLSESPSAVVFNDLLYCFHKGGGQDARLWCNVFDGTTWAGDTVVAGTCLSESPSAVVFNDRLYCFHKGAGTDTTLWCNVFDGMNWAGDTPVPKTFLTNSPSAVVFNGLLYCFHQDGANSGTLCCNVFDGNDWSGDGPIPNTSLTNSPGAVVFNDQLYCFHQGAGKNGQSWLWCNTFDGTNWLGDGPVPNTGMTDSPCPVVFNGWLCCFHQGWKYNGQLWFNTFTHEWQGDTQIGKVGMSCSPSCAVFQGQLYCLHQGYADSGTLWVSVFDQLANDLPPNESWMTDLAVAHAGFAGLTLGELCLPATHDSGTYDLQPSFTPDVSEKLRSIMTTVDSVRDQLDVIPYVSSILDPLDWAIDDIFATTRDLSQTTTSDTLQQLIDGIRCLDLRVYYNESDASFYTYHGMLGVSLDTILQDINQFITVHAPDGEIVYVTMGHDLPPPGSPSQQSGFSSDQVDLLSNLVWGIFSEAGLVFGPADCPSNVDNLFQCTYADIIGPAGSSCSKVIVVAQQLNGPPDPSNPGKSLQKVWPAYDYSPPSGSKTGGNYFLGAYTDTDDVSAMLQAQVVQSQTALAKDLRFALYLTLTPPESVVVSLTVAHLRNTLLVLAAEAAVIPFVGLLAAGFLLSGAAALAIYETVKTKYSSIQQLSGFIFDSSNPTVSAILQNEFTGDDLATPTFIYMDYYELYTSQNAAGASVSQLVAAAQTVCLGNLGVSR